MSNIGKQPISIPEGVEVSRKEDNIFVKGKLGELNQEFKSDIQISINDNEVVVTRNSDEKIQRELHGLTRVLIANMVEGVSQGFQKELNLVGVGYTADASKGNFLLLNVGFSHPVYVQCPESITVKTPETTEIVITGIDKQLVGQFSARIRQIRKPEPYKGKGIRYFDEIIRKKAGKAVGAK